MYSHEIQSKLEFCNYSINSDDYIKICNSIQISRVKYEPYGNYFEIWTKDNYYWKLNVYRKEE